MFQEGEQSERAEVVLKMSSDLGQKGWAGLLLSLSEVSMKLVPGRNGMTVWSD